MITLLGTGHVFDLRRRVQEEIYRRDPGIVAIELDPLRFQALQDPARAKHGPPVVRYLARMQERMAERSGVKAGDEMLAAADAARDLRVPLALIDRDARITLRRVWKEMRFAERVRLLGALVASAFVPSKKMEEDLAKLEGDYADLFEELGRKFPTIRRVVIDERDQVMAEALSRLAQDHPQVVAVVGDGHVEGIRGILEGRGLPVDAVRLKDLKTKPDTAPKDEPASVTFRVEYDA